MPRGPEARPEMVAGDRPQEGGPWAEGDEGERQSVFRRKRQAVGPHVDRIEARWKD